MSFLSGYKIEEKIASGVGTVIYRGYDEEELHSVIIKVLSSEYPTLEEITHLRQEYVISHNLELDGVIKAYSLEKYGKRLALILEDFGGQSLRELLTSRQISCLEFLHIGIALAEILGQLHQVPIIHKNINPSNILINPETGQVKITDFSIASCLSGENLTIRNPDLLEGTLAYISPEQTGRMNRRIDYRTDFYSLGATFYEMLTGQLPFTATEPLELIHAHLAKTPVPPHQLNHEIPEILSSLVMKLLAKNAEDRYQSATGLKFDLETIKEVLQRTGKIVNFPLAKRDHGRELLIPEKLYGREMEVGTLMNAFARVSSGATEMMLVSGYSGIGKTSVVNELHKPIVEGRGYFIAGKFDQFKRNIPYYALIQAFGSLIRQLLTESSQQIAIWKEKLLEALAANGKIVIDVIPEVELIIGEQLEVPLLNPSESQNRFNRLFQQFIQVFCQPEHPLVIFLDDLQWVDLASLQLIELLIGDLDSQYLLLVGAYRDNEVIPSSPLIQTIEKIQLSQQAVVNRIVLKPLLQEHVSQLVTETLGEATIGTVATELLAELVFHKTGGNPFFLTQLLKTLYSENLLIYDPDSGSWQWDLESIQAVGIGDRNVVELVASNIRKLPEITQQLLKLAACLGNQFNLKVLAIANQKSTTLTAAQLWQALQTGIILPLSDSYKIPLLFGEEEQQALGDIQVNYKFLHDRVQQAAYSLLPESERKNTHLTIGKLLLQNTTPEKRQENIFALVNQLNFGKDSIAAQSEKDELAQFNLIAAQKAKTVAAYKAALKYLNIGLELLAADSWTENYDLTLDLYIEAVEAEYLNSNFQQSQVLASVALRQAKTLLEKVRIYEIQFQSCIAQNQMQKAIDTALPVLEMLGIHLELEPPTELIIENLVPLPPITAPHQLAALRILNFVSDAAYIANPELYNQIVFTQVSICSQYGNSPRAAIAYVAYALFLCGVLGDIDSGYRFGQLALRILDQFEAREFKSSILEVFNGHIRQWKEHTRETIAPLILAFQSGMETGELVYSGYAALNYCTHLFFLGEHLESVAQQQKQYLHYLAKINLEYHVCYGQIGRQLTLNLLGLGVDKLQLIGEAFDETAILPNLKKTNNGTSLFSYYLAKSLLAYWFKQPAKAIKSFREGEKYVQSVPGLLIVAEHNFYYSLALLANYQGLKDPEAHLCQVAANQDKMQDWAYHAPDNFQHKYELVEAEKARVLGQNWSAMELYDRAIARAKDSGYLQEEALANELAAEFYLVSGREKIARTYLVDAYYGYISWGALAKVADLESRYPQFLAHITTPATTSLESNPTIRSTGASKLELDLSTLIKASQAISSEIVLDKLLSKLMQILMENAGADKGLLLLQHEETLLLAAKGIVVSDQVEVELPFLTVEQYPDLPLSAINYVYRTKKVVVLNQVTKEGLFTRDAYIVKHQPKSILALPVIHQGKLLGIFYLENRLAEGVFTHERLELLKILLSQVSISIENARLYQSLEHQAFYDSLTDLPNRPLFNEQLNTALANAKRYQYLMAVLFLDLDRFKTINDTLGHTFGDRLLQNFAQRLNSCLREGDTLARWGGDEFTLLLPHIINREDASNISQRIIASLEHPFKLEAQELHINTSIGIALYPQDGEDAETLLRNADAALYRAKNYGRHNYQFYRPTMNTAPLLQLENMLHQALKRKEFVLYYQPQVNIHTGKISGLEALVRWQHPERGLISPVEFIPVAEETGLIIPLGLWVFREACRQLRTWQNQHLTPSSLIMSVNFSVKQFAQDNLMEQIDQILTETQIDSQHLKLEITESVIIDNVASTSRMLEQFKKRRIKLSIDDFGTGYSSLSYLQRFPIDTLKIDHSFIKRIGPHGENVEIVNAIVTLAHNLKIEVVAEGVETAEQVRILENIGCEFAQGYFFFKPLPAEALVNLMKFGKVI